MDRQQILLAKALNAAGVELSVNSFDERLILQKAVYLIQSAGIRLDYRFRWYLRGPYSPDMTADAFGIINEGQTAKEELKSWKLDEKSSQIAEKLRSLLQRSNEATESQAKRLELLASTLFLYNTNQAVPADSVGTSCILEKNGKDFTPEQVEEAVRELRLYELIS
ncbi:MAG: hypothetical protein ACRC8S_13010 [Fimbriiglobus sp.]